VVVENSEIERAIVLEHSLIRDIPARIQDSLIGRHVNLVRSPIKPKAYKLMLGDHSQVGIF
jgi:glucose-1-phosphate thymidylyltransferase